MADLGVAFGFRHFGVTLAFETPGELAIHDQPLWSWPYHLAREALAFLWYAALIAAGRHRR